MASSENRINVDDLREHGDPTGTGGAFTDLELKREKFHAKSSFTGIKNKVLFLIDQPENPGYWEIQEALLKWTALWKALWT